MPHPVDAQIVFFPTDNLDRTTAFYQEMLGLPLVLDQGVCRIFRATAGAFIGFCQKAAAPTDPEAIITLVTQDVDGWVNALREKGVEVERGPVFNAKFDIYHAFLRDPNGYLVEIQRFDDPRWDAA